MEKSVPIMAGCVREEVDRKGVERLSVRGGLAICG